MDGFASLKVILARVSAIAPETFSAERVEPEHLAALWSVDR